MRLWHKDLLRALPQKQICSQYRECCAIAKSIKENGTPNHILVNKIMDYQIYDFIKYTALVIYEMKQRGYKVNPNCFDKYNLSDDKAGRLAFDMSKGYITNSYVFESWHNDIYLRECLYNLEEKAMCGGIPLNEWKIIYDQYKNKFELWSGE